MRRRDQVTGEDRATGGRAGKRIAIAAVGLALLFPTAGELGRSDLSSQASARAATIEAAACRTVRRTVSVRLDDDRYPRTTDHILDAIRSGERRLLHIERRGADRRRAEALRGIPTRPGYDRDEYPPASTREGGRGADVRYVPSRDNRGAGAVMGGQLRPFCNGQAFRIRVF
jgi:hypothetical protein